MFHDDPIFETEDNNVLVWVGDLTPDELDDYLDEPGGSADNEPHSRFMADLGRWCDHDFVWAEALGTNGTMDALIRANGIDDASFRAELLDRAAGMDTLTCMLVLWNARSRPSSSRSFDLHNGRLKCLGSWQQASPLTDGF